ncbi:MULTISPECIES: FAD-binding oxidoreductase [unclassified Streptomyces]|uniref:FAD-binding oxidoreductase n=1 Tax=unclassified Streptomyces TaxID=2593676 RepID=UPI00380993BC
MTEPARRTEAPRTDEVTHMKWWGWGVEGVGFHHEDKPAFAPFVHRAVGLDLRAAARTERPDFSQVEVPASTAPEEFVAALRGIVGPGNAVVDDLARVVHTYGKSLRDLVRLRAGKIARCPDVVVYPADEAQVRGVVDAAVAADAVIIPFGGGSNIAGSLEPHPDEPRVVVSLDLGRLRRVLEIDTDSGLARIQAGTLGPDLEEQLNRHGWTMGHFPDSFTHSSLGGWVATRSSGMQSDKYGDIADIVKGLRVVRPGGVLVIRAVPSASTGPSVREMVVGSEGRLGVITEITVQVHRIPERRAIHAYFFKDFDHGLAAMREIAESDVPPSVTRVSDAHETGFSLATGKESKGVKKAAQAALTAYLKRRGWKLDEMCLSFIGFEGGEAHVKLQKSHIDRIVRKHQGIGVGKGPGALYDRKKFDTPYIRDFLLDRGAAGDVSETAGPWSRLRDIHAAVYAAADRAYEEIGRRGWTMSHLSHSYHSGACLYFTFAFVFGDDPLGEYDTVKRAIQQAFADAGGTVSHHHGVGLEHAPWLAEDISAQGVAVMAGLFEAADPGGNFNPRKIVV